MKKMAIKLFLFAGLFATVCALFLVAPYPRNESSHELRQKHVLLEAAKGPKIVLVGGSGVHYSLSAQQMQETLPEYAVINMGFNAGLGLQFNLNEVKPSLRSGDVVVLFPEYNNYEAGAAGTILTLKTINALPETRQYVSSEQYRRLLREHWMQLLPVKAQSFLDCAVLYATHSSQSMNAHGDIVTKTAPRDVAKMPFAFTYDEASIDNSLTILREFEAFCRAKGVAVVMGFPSFPTVQYGKEAADLERLHQKLAKDCPIPLLFTPSQAVYPPEQFDDTFYHMNRRGRAQHTDVIIRSLRPYLSRRA